MAGGSEVGSSTWEVQVVLCVVCVSGGGGGYLFKTEVSCSLSCGRECSVPKLVSFKGRAKDFSPRARIRSWMG